MIYSDLIIPENNWKYIQQAVQNNRIPHALLFHGPRGSGKEGCAIEVIAWMNCKTPTGSVGACGICSSCIKVIGFQHPNVLFIHPMPSTSGNIHRDGGLFHTLPNTSLKHFREMLVNKGIDPYSDIDLKANTIPVQIIRECRKDLFMSSVESGWRIVLIFQADLLCTGGMAAANALLKILEEPPENTLFILVTDQKEKLLDTINSRCHDLFFPPLNDSAIETLLIQRKIPEDRINVLSKMCRGDVQTALILNENYDLIESERTIILKAIFSENPGYWRTFQNRITDLSRSGMVSMFNTFFYIHAAIFKDLLLVQKIENGANLIFPDLNKKYESILEAYPGADFHACIDIIESAMTFFDKNVNVSLNAINIILDLRIALNGKEVKAMNLLETEY